MSQENESIELNLEEKPKKSHFLTYLLLLILLIAIIFSLGYYFLNNGVGKNIISNLQNSLNKKEMQPANQKHTQEYAKDEEIERLQNALIQKETMKLSLYKGNLQKDLQFIFRGERERIARDTEGLHQGSRKILDLEKSKFNLIELRVKNADPETTLSKGYTLTLDANGKFIRNKNQLKHGDTLTTRFKDGCVQSIVK